MANATRRGGGGDVVLESRHLVGLFVLMVVIFGVVFVLGYELGKNQSPGPARASATSPESDVSSAQPPVRPPVNAPAGGTLQPNTKAPVSSAAPSPGKPSATKPPAEVSKSGPPPAKGNSPAPNKAAPSVKPPVAGNAPAKNPANSGNSSSGSMNAPLIAHGSILVQVAAMTKESDALEMAQALQKKRFPAFVVPPGPDHFYHVQVGPYADVKSAEAAQKALQNEGFKTLIKR